MAASDRIKYTHVYVQGGTEYGRLHVLMSDRLLFFIKNLKRKKEQRSTVDHDACSSTLSFHVGIKWRI